MSRQEIAVLRRLIREIDGLEPPEDPHSDAWLLGFFRAKQRIKTFLEMRILQGQNHAGE